MPKKLDLSDRYARGQRRSRRRAVSRPIEDEYHDQGPDTVAFDEAPAVVTPAPVRPAARVRAATVQNYQYVRTDLIRIGIVTGIVLILMAVLFILLRSA